MKKYLLISFFTFLSCLLYAQERNDFEDYLSQFKEIQLPFQMSIDSVSSFFPNPTGYKSIPINYVHTFICEPGKACDDDLMKYEYQAGIQLKLRRYIAVITSKDCDDCGSKYGRGIGYYLLTIHTLDGKWVSQDTIAQGSDQHFYFGTFTKGNTPHSFLSLSMKQGTMYDYLDKENSIFEGIMDYYTYTINEEGIIRKEKNKSTNIRISWGLEGVKILKEWK